MSTAHSRLAMAVASLALVTLRATAFLVQDAHAAPPNDHKIARTGQAMGTTLHLTLWEENEAKAARMTDQVFAEFKRVNRLMSSWLSTSDVARINAAAGNKAVKVSAEVFAVIEQALLMAHKTGGAFDITVGSFRGLWKFDQDRDGNIPSAAAVKKRLRLVGYQGLVLDKKRRTVKLKHKGSRMTLGGIAKGYAIDRAVALLHQADFVDFILQAGGDLYVSGRKGPHRWRVGIRDPRGKSTLPFADALIENATFSTSGDYERSVVKDGVRYHHILNPKTGHPAKQCRSVTVKAHSALVADAWSTALFVMGAPKGLKLVEANPELEAVWVDAHNEVHVSSGLRDTLMIRHPPTDGI